MFVAMLSCAGDADEACRKRVPESLELSATVISTSFAASELPNDLDEGGREFAGHLIIRKSTDRRWYLSDSASENEYSIIDDLSTTYVSNASTPVALINRDTKLGKHILLLPVQAVFFAGVEAELGGIELGALSDLGLREGLQLFRNDQVELWLDPNCDYLPKRLQLYAEGRVTCSVVFDFDTVDPTHFKGWTTEVYNRAGARMTMQEVTIDEITIDPPLDDDDFKIAFRPGTIVKDRIKGAEYEVASTGELVERIKPLSVQIEQGRHSQRWILWGVGLAAAATVVILIKRRR